MKWSPNIFFSVFLKADVIDRFMSLDSSFINRWTGHPKSLTSGNSKRQTINHENESSTGARREKKR